MTSKFKTPGELWRIPPLELTLWLSLMAVCCLWSVAAHGRGMQTSQIQVYDVASERERTASSAFRLDINTATEAELVLLPGIGPRRAQAIVKERAKRGAFNTVWELCEVPGLTKALIQRLEPMLQAVPARSLIIPQN
jgi:competence ComEA-like helix-hairpin-helix protein